MGSYPSCFADIFYDCYCHQCYHHEWSVCAAAAACAVALAATVAAAAAAAAVSVATAVAAAVAIAVAVAIAFGISNGSWWLPVISLAGFAGDCW